MDASLSLEAWIRQQEQELGNEETRQGQQGQGQQRQAPMRIWLEEPEMVREGIMGSKTYWRYTVCFIDEHEQLRRIKHRYSEFEALQSALMQAYGPLGFLIPSLPGKKLVGNNDKTFITARMRGLTIFCGKVMNNPFLRNDNLWKDFLAHSTANGENVGAIRYRELVESSKPSELCADDQIEQVKHECIAIERQMRATLDSMRTAINSLRVFHGTLTNLSTSFSNWEEVETKEVGALNGMVKDLDGNVSETIPTQHEVKASISIISQMLASHLVAIGKIPDYTGFLVEGLLEYQLSQVEDLKELLRARDLLTAAIDALRKKIARLEAVDQAKRNEQQISDARSQLEDKERDLESFKRGLINITLPQVVKDRVAVMREALGFLGVLSLSATANSQVACEQFFQQMAVQPSDIFRQATTVLEKLALPSMEDIPAQLSSTVPFFDAGSSSLLEATQHLAYTSIASFSAPALPPPPAPVAASDAKRRSSIEVAQDTGDNEISEEVSI